MFKRYFNKYIYILTLEDKAFLGQRKIPAIKQHLLLILIISGLLYACSGVPNDATCIPTIYPNGEESVTERFEIVSYEVSASFEEVIDYYNDQLDIKPFWTGGTWHVTEVNEEQTLFECTAAFRGYDQEKGCILVIKNENEATIETIWFLMQNTTAFSCDEALPNMAKSGEN